MAQRHHAGTDQQASEQVYGLDDKKITSRMGQQRQHAVAILNNGAGDQNGQGCSAFGDHGDKKQVGARLGNNAHKPRKAKNQPAIVGDKLWQADKVCQQGDQRQGRKGPDKYSRQMFDDDVFPEMLVEKMIGNNTYADKSATGQQ